MKSISRATDGRARSNPRSRHTRARESDERTRVAKTREKQFIPSFRRGVGTVIARAARRTRAFLDRPGVARLRLRSSVRRRARCERRASRRDARGVDDGDRV
jgi:hypothetical protein